MLQNEVYHKDYTAFVNNIFVKGYAEHIPDELQVKPGKIWYLHVPHHGIYQPRKLNKIRVVFDASAKYMYNNISLNDALLQGPDLTNSLVGVLSRFREFPIAFMGDIESMFFQVKVPENQQDFQRFLWWPDGNLNGELKEYRMTVHLFGAVSSPSVVNFVLRHIAEQLNSSTDSLISDTIRNNFYVDDCLKSVSDTTTASHLIKELMSACSKGGFHLTKFLCNSKDVLQGIPKTELAKDVIVCDLDYEKIPLERALGIQWCVQTDTFRFTIMLKGKPTTRRGILSTISSIYDPLGFIAPVILPMKKLLQDLCQEKGLGWDDEVLECYRVRWVRWLQELPALEHVSIDRCLIPSSLGTVVSKQLHVFSDASKDLWLISTSVIAIITYTVPLSWARQECPQ